MYDIRDYFESPEQEFFHREEDTRIVEKQESTGFVDNLKSSMILVYSMAKNIWKDSK